MFDKRGRAANVSNTKNAPLWARLWYSTQREGQGTCRTPKTCPQGHVRGVRHEGKGRKCAEHYEHAHKRREGNSRERVEHQKHALAGMFVVSDTRGMEGTRRTRREGKGENARNIRTRPWGTCSGVRDVPKGRRTRRTPQTDPQGPVCGVRDEGKGKGRAEHQNTPFWACFDVRDVRKGGGTRRTPRTRPQGRVCGVRDEGKAPNTKTRHSGRVLVFKTRGRGVGTRRAPQTRPCGRVWGVRDKGEERERAEHQKHATWGVFSMFSAFGVFGTSMLGLYGARQGEGGGESSWRRGERRERRVFDVFGGCIEWQLVRFLKKRKNIAGVPCTPTLSVFPCSLASPFVVRRRRRRVRGWGW